jgi:hypothetical protein
MFLAISGAKAMQPAPFEMSFLAEGLPILVGTSGDFLPHHARMEEIIVAQGSGRTYTRGYNFAIDSDEPLFEALYARTLATVQDLYRTMFSRELVLSASNKRTCWAFVLDESRPAVDVWHNHITTSTHNAVYYVRANEDDAIRVIVPDSPQDPRQGREVEIAVAEGTLLVMPNWLFHKPKAIARLPGLRRISINMEVIAEPAAGP